MMKFFFNSLNLGQQFELEEFIIKQLQLTHDRLVDQSSMIFLQNYKLNI